MPSSRVYLLTEGSKTLVHEGTLQVLQSKLDGRDVYLLLLGGVRFALRPEVPCLEMAARDFVFPTDEGTYGLVVSDSIDAEVLEVFSVLLQEHTSFRAAAAPQPIAALPDKPDRMVTVAHTAAAGLGTGSVVVATGIVKGGQMVGKVLVRGGHYLTTKLSRNAEASKVSQQSRDRLAKAQFVSGAACKVSKALVIGAVATTEMMAAQLHEAIKSTDIGKKLAGDADKPNPRLDAAKHVGKATLSAVLNIYTAIETAVFGVAQDAAAATVTVVQHKYGEELGAHTKSSLNVATEVVVAARDVSKLGVKAIAKKTMIKTTQHALTSDAERAAEAEAKQQAAAAAGPSAAIKQQVGAAMGLPQGMDPLVAMEAAAAVAQLSSASKQLMGEQRAHSHAHAHAQPAAFSAARASGAPSSPSSRAEGEEAVLVSTATATGATPALAQAAATQAATQALQAQARAQPIVAQPIDVKKRN